MKQLNFIGILILTVKDSLKQHFFFQKEAKTAPKRPILFWLVYQADFFGYFKIIWDYCRRFPKARRIFSKTDEDFRRLTKRSDHCRRCLKNPSNFSSETANIIKMAKLTANTKHYGQITLNTKSHSRPLKRLKYVLASIKFKKVEFCY